MYKLGLVSISFRNHSVEEIIKAVKLSGLSCIEWGSDVHAPFDDINQLKKIVELQNKYNIFCSSYGTYFRLGITPLQELEGYINAAKILNTNILRLWCGSKNSEDYTKDEKAQLFSECKKAAEIAKNHNVVLCMECHNNTYTNRKDATTELIKEILSPHFKMYWQPNQYLTKEENIDYARAISPYTECIHVFNWEGIKKYPLEEGISKWREYLLEFSKDKTLLLEFMPDDKIETLTKEATVLKMLGGK